MAPASSPFTHAHTPTRQPTHPQAQPLGGGGVPYASSQPRNVQSGPFRAMPEGRHADIACGKSCTATAAHFTACTPPIGGPAQGASGEGPWSTRARLRPRARRVPQAPLPTAYPSRSSGPLRLRLRLPTGGAP